MLGETVGSILFTSLSTNGYLIQSTNQTINVIYTPQTRITHIHLISTSTPSNLTIQNGLGGTTQINITGTSNMGIDFDFGIYGIVFPLGAYVTYDGNQLDGVITCKAEEISVNSVGSGGGGGSGFIIDDSGNIILDDSGNMITS